MRASVGAESSSPASRPRARSSESRNSWTAAPGSFRRSVSRAPAAAAEAALPSAHAMCGGATSATGQLSVRLCGPHADLRTSAHALAHCTSNHAKLATITFSVRSPSRARACCPTGPGTQHLFEQALGALVTTHHVSEEPTKRLGRACAYMCATDVRAGPHECTRMGQQRTVRVRCVCACVTRCACAAHVPRRARSASSAAGGILASRSVVASRSAPDRRSPKSRSAKPALNATNRPSTACQRQLKWSPAHSLSLPSLPSTAALSLLPPLPLLLSPSSRARARERALRAVDPILSRARCGPARMRAG